MKTLSPRTVPMYRAPAPLGSRSTAEAAPRAVTFSFVFALLLDVLKALGAAAVLWLGVEFILPGLVPSSAVVVPFLRVLLLLALAASIAGVVHLHTRPEGAARNTGRAGPWRGQR